MKFRKGVSLDTSQVSDRRGMKPGGLALGGGGLIGVIFLVVQLLSGGGVDLGGLEQLDLGTGGGTGSPTHDLSSECRTGEDANQREDCRIVAVINSVQAFWENELRGYRQATTVFFEGAVDSGCGRATSASGPFYCSAGEKVYIDLGFYNDLRTRFGASGGPFAEAYVIAHEYGHHVENLLGVLERKRGSAAGPQSAGVRVELQADCLAGMWAAGAVGTGFIEELTRADIEDGLNAAAAIGDDRIQEQFQGEVDPEGFTHGTSEQRQRWFLVGYEQGRLPACDTFAVPEV